MAVTKRYESPLGEILLAADGDGLTGLWFRGQHYFAAGLDDDREAGRLPVLEEACRWLDCYFDGRRPEALPPIHLIGTAFQKTVWELLLEIPYGTTTTYGALAAKLALQMGRPHVSAQAVGGAVGRNRISILVPCHRVVGAGGSLVGYAGGVQRKLKLLELEGAETGRLFVPKKRTAL